MPDKRTPVLLGLGALLALVVSVAPAAAQAAGPAGGGDAGDADDGAARWFPASPSFAPLLATPREVGLRGSFVLADRGLPPGRDFRGRNVEAEVGIGHRIPVLRLQDEGEASPELTLGFEVGVFSRFHMETPAKDLVNADFRVAAPLSGRFGPWEGRLAILHVSSHVGDDFDARFGVPFQQITRDGIEALVARRFGHGVRVYGGADLNFHANPGVERAAARWGAEWDPGPPSERRDSPAGGSEGGPAEGDGGSDGLETWPFAAADLAVTTLTERVAGTAVAGMGVRLSGVVLRLEARGHWGPSPMGRFRTVDESFFGLGLRVEP